MTDKKLFYGLWLGLFLLILFAYRHHFDNDFHFDDGHTIQNNQYIRSLKNIPLFFTKGPETFSTLPANQLYRPVVTTSLAFDFWLSSVFDKDGSGYNTFYYHLSMFIGYLLLLILFYLFTVKIFDKAFDSHWNRWIALFATSWYGIHTVNAETLNYIISRSDGISTFFVLAAFVIFIYFPRHRKYGFFLIPFALGMLTKLTAAMFGPLLVVYYFLFEFDDVLNNAATKKMRKKVIVKAALQTAGLAAFTLAGIVFVIANQADTYTPGGSSRFLYLITQPFILFHYFISFFVPYNLSADTDWGLLQSVWDVRFFTGVVFIILMLFAAWKAYKKKISRPVTFGILWFFISLAPTSSLIPLAEVMNDHRMFYPFAGLMIAVVWSAALWFLKNEDRIINSYPAKNLLILAVAFILSAHTFGVMHRSEVWDNGKSLWYDVTQKSPHNGRGLMNYGLRLVAEGKYNEGLDYYKRALNYMPYYNYLYTNMAIVYNLMDSLDKAEWYYKRSIQLNPSSHNGYYYYGIFLRDKGRNAEAVTNFRKVTELSPAFVFARYALMELYMKEDMWKELDGLVSETLSMFPDDVTANYYKSVLDDHYRNIKSLEENAVAGGDKGKMLELSLLYYNAGDFEKCVDVCKKILSIDPGYVQAYNNLIAALNNLGRFDEAVDYGKKALELAPGNGLLKNNIAVARKRKSLLQRLETTTAAEDLIALSLEFYGEQMYAECVEACEKSLVKKPGNPVAYNNICSAYNAMQQWEKAVEAGEKALALKPGWQLAENNLAYAKKNLK